MSVIRSRTLTALGMGALAFTLCFIGCSSDDSSTSPPGQDGGNPDTGGNQDTGTPLGQATQTGQVIRLPVGGGTTKTTIAGATVDLGNGKSTITFDGDAGGANKGKYSLSFTQQTPFFMRISKPAAGQDTLTTLIEQEWQLSGDADRGLTPVPDLQTTNLLFQVIHLSLGYAVDPDNKGVIGVGVIKGTCPTEEGTVVALDTGASFAAERVAADDAGTDDAGADADAGPGDAGPGDAGPGDAGPGDAGAGPLPNQVVYFNHTTGLPDGKLHAIQKDQIQPGALIFNVTPGYVKVKVTPPAGCRVLSFPITDPQTPTIQYTGRAKVEVLGSLNDPARPPFASPTRPASSVNWTNGSGIVCARFNSNSGNVGPRSSASCARGDSCMTQRRSKMSSTAQQPNHDLSDVPWLVNVQRQLDVKMVLSAHGDVEAKAYLGFHPRFVLA